MEDGGTLIPVRGMELPGLGEMDGRAAVRVFLYSSATDMRRSFDTLGALVVERMGKDSTRVATRPAGPDVGVHR